MAKQNIQQDEQETPICKKCITQLDWQECSDCEEGFSYHDCGEDTCCCLNPENNIICDTCEGKGGWWFCPVCKIVIKLEQLNPTEAIPPTLESSGYP